ncbi:golgin subfamily A member 4-like isoform X2 [Mya arenaria]|uniref:golgin subfamily A member 4-like isoform X2 n=1 Tax=Mya arenaria TaxID=6604 RepID=UPI0022E57F74|nr:golgin subfamily A member 4-like isoform X2 [Mya arenaria]
MATVFMNRHQGSMRFTNNSTLSDDEDGVQSGSATGFSDGEREERPNPQTRGTKRAANAFDPVTQILDKIDAELVSLTRSQGSSSTATTATDNTVIHRPGSRGSSSLENGRLENGDELSISQLGPSSNFKPSMSQQSSGSRYTGSSDRDTGIGTGTNSLYDSKHREPDLRPLEPGDNYRDRGGRGGAHRRAGSAPGTTTEMAFLNGQHLSDDDKREQQANMPLHAKQVDDKFREILQKRKNGRVSDNEDTQTIRTEDFADQFQDTMVYGSEGRNLPRPVPNPVPRPVMIDRSKMKVPTPAEARPRKVAGPGYPPIYPKPTVTSSLPRPSSRSPIKLTPGHGSDAESVRTEDFEHSFKEMLVPSVNQVESDLDTANTDLASDPIHSKVKQLLKATAKSSRRIVTHYKKRKDRIEPISSTTSNSILKTRSRSTEDKPRSEQKTKQHVRISPQPQYQSETKGDESDDTLCSDKEDMVLSPRSQVTVSTRPDDDTHREIVRESDRIRREMERERRSKSSSPERDVHRDRSPTRTYLSLTSQPKNLYDKGDKPNVAAVVGGGVGGSTCRGGGASKSLSDEEKERTAELRATQSALDVTQSALLEARKDLKGIQAQYEDARTQLMLSEYKRETSTKELARLSDEVRRKQNETNQLESLASRRRDELKQFDAIGFTKDEAMKIIEENEKMKGRLRNLDAVHAERDELIQQLDSTKQELFTEQKRARERIEELQEEIENTTNNYEQGQGEREDMAKRLQKLETAYKKMEREKNELIQGSKDSIEKTRQYEEERDSHRREKADWRQRDMEDLDTARNDLVKMTGRVAALQDEVRARDDLNNQLRGEMQDLERQLEQERTSRSSILEEHKKTLQTLRKETDVAMVQMRESLFLEKQKTVDQMREELEQERRDIAVRSGDRYEARIAELETILKAKNEELSHLNKLADKLEDDVSRTRARKEEEIKEKVSEAIAKEKAHAESEQMWAVQQEREALQGEHRTQISSLTAQLDNMKDQQRGLEARLKEQRQELEDLKTSNKTVMHEKLIAVARAKELMRQEHTAELERIKEQTKNEHKKELDKLRETIRAQEAELRSLREERLRHVRTQKESSLSLDRTERTLVNEINEECRKTSEILGLSPRKVNFSSSQGSSVKNPTTSALQDKGSELFLFTQAQEVCRANEFTIVASPPVGDKNVQQFMKDDRVQKSRDWPTVKAQYSSERANLRACNEELRLHVSGLQHELDLQKNTSSVVDREKVQFRMEEDITSLPCEFRRIWNRLWDRNDEALANLRRQLEREKEEEMARLKERLVRGLSTNEYRGMTYTPDNDIAARQQVKSPPTERHLRQVSEQQQHDLQRLEREINKLSINNGGGEDVEYAKRLAHLQGKVRQLQDENNALRHAKLSTITSSSPNLTTPNSYNNIANHRKFTMRSPSPSRDQQRLASALELRTREHDYETATLTEHQRRNRDIMSHKMAEMSKLQNTLTNQAKELIQLEKAYTQLNQSALVPRPRSALR